MNTIIGMLLLSIACSITVSAQSAVVAWSAFSGGYGTPGGSGTQVAGTTGQSFMGSSSGGNGALGTGFLPGLNILHGATLVSVNAGWNMLSLPRRASSVLKVDLYPDATSSAFTFGEGYVQRESLSVGMGFWLKFPGLGTVALNGDSVLAETLQVVAGWNLIGGTSLPVDVSTIVSEPPGLTTTSFFGFSAGYFVADTLAPGRAYWVKAAQSGDLYLGGAAELAGRSRITITPTAELPPPAPGVADRAPHATGTPVAYALGQNYPNPFNPETRIFYSIATESHVSLSIFDLLGRELKTLVEESKQPGEYSAIWDAANMPSGVYFYRLAAGGFVETKKMILMR